MYGDLCLCWQDSIPKYPVRLAVKFHDLKQLKSLFLLFSQTRYDVRGALYDLSEAEAGAGGDRWEGMTEEERAEEERCDYERYLALYQDEFQYQAFQGKNVCLLCHTSYLLFCYLSSVMHYSLMHCELPYPSSFFVLCPPPVLLTFLYMSHLLFTSSFPVLYMFC